jgi:SWIM zinc finger
MSTTVSHPLPSAQAQAIADLTGYEDAATLRWQQACMQAANTLTALPNGRYVTVRMERMRQGLELAQRGAVTLPEDGEQLSAVVRSGHNVYQVDTRLLTCTCADYQKHLQACKHLLATEIHTGALGLAGRAEEPLNPPAPEPALTTSLPPAAPTTASWPISEAPASLNIKLKIGNMGLMLTMRDVDDLKLQRRATMSLPWLQAILHGCEANLAARQQEAEHRRQQAEAERQAQAQSLDEQIAAAVQAAMRAQTSRNNGQSPQQRTAAAPPQPPDADGLASTPDHDPSWCPKHQVTMRWHEGNARGPGWFSHQLADGSYCKGK